MHTSAYKLKIEHERRTKFVRIERSCRRAAAPLLEKRRRRWRFASVRAFVTSFRSNTRDKFDEKERGRKKKQREELSPDGGGDEGLENLDDDLLVVVLLELRRPRHHAGRGGDGCGAGEAQHHPHVGVADARDQPPGRGGAGAEEGHARRRLDSPGPAAAVRVEPCGGASAEIRLREAAPAATGGAGSLLPVALEAAFVGGRRRVHELSHSLDLFFSSIRWSI